MNGQYADLHQVNLEQHSSERSEYDETLYSFSRFSDAQKMLIASNFSDDNKHFTLVVPKHLITQWSLPDGQYAMQDLLSGKKLNIVVENQEGHVSMMLGSLQSVVLSLVES